MPQVVQELVSKSFPFVSAWHESSNVEEFNGNRSLSINTRTVIWLAAIGDVETRTGTGYLEVANCSLGVDCGKAGMD